MRHHIATGDILSVAQANEEEQMFSGPEAGAGGLRCRLGCSLEELISSTSGIDSSSSSINSSSVPSSSHLTTTTATLAELNSLIDLYAGEEYVLTWRNGTAFVVLWDTAGPVDVLRAMWQATWLHQCNGNDTSSVSTAQNHQKYEKERETVLLKESLACMMSQFSDLETAATAAGWELQKGVFPIGNFRLCKSM